MYCKLIKAAAEAIPYLRQGRLVAFPTNTSYGLAVDALQGFALQRLRNIKQRPQEKTFTVFMSDALRPTFLRLTAAEEELIKKSANQTLTILVKPAPDLSHLALDGLVGLRLIDHPLMRELAELAAVPLTATSANPSGQAPAYTPRQILEYFPGRLDDTTYDLSLAAILDAGPLPQSKPSQIIRLNPTSNEVQVIRD